MKRVFSSPSLPRLALLAVLAALLLSACTGLTPAPAGSAAAATAGSRIVIFHSNDVHGRIDAFAKIKPILDAERKTGADVFYVSAGDNFTGDPVIDRYDPPGEPMIEILGRLRLDLLTPGNHEFDYGLGPLRKMATRIRTISANIEAPEGIFPELRPSAVLKTKSGAKIAVFGLIQVEPENKLPSTHPDKLGGLRFSEPLAKALELKALRAEGQVLIALTHIGHDQDLALARQMPEIDVIIGGHSHTRVDPAAMVGGVLVAQAGSGNLFLGRIDLVLKDGRVAEKKGRLIDLSQVKEEDAAIKALVAEYRNNPAMARVLAEAPLEITGVHALGCLMTDAIRRAHGLDIAFQNNGGIRVGRLPRSITLRDVYTLDPFGNAVVEMAMTPAEIRELVKSAFEKRGDIDLQVSGITYVVRTDAAQKVREVLLKLPDGAPLPEDRTYKVGMSSYIASSYSFSRKDPGRSLQSTTADALILYLEKGADLSLYKDLSRAVWEKSPESSGD